MGFLKRACTWIALTWAISTPLVQPAAAAPSEYDVKAVFIFNFVQFVDWPPDAFADAEAPLVICVLGTDPFGATLDDIVRNERIEGRALIVRRHQQPSPQLTDCHILFVDRSMRDALPQVLTRLDGQPILTVGDFPGFARDGGMIRFVTADQKIRLHINLDAARAKQLSISSKLLRPAHVLRPGED